MTLKVTSILANGNGNQTVGQVRMSPKTCIRTYERSKAGKVGPEVSELHYPSAREVFTDAILTVKIGTEMDTNVRRVPSVAELRSTLNARDVWDLIYEVMEAQAFFLGDDASMTRLASEVEVQEVSAELSRLGVSQNWSTPFAPESQRLVQTLRDGLPRDELGLDDRDPSGSIAEFMAEARERSGGGPWWTPPYGPGIVLSSVAQPGLPATCLLGNEDDFGESEARVYPATGALGPVRVWEVDCAQDWIDLVSIAPVDVTRGRGSDWGRYGPKRRWEIPDWEVIAGSFDAVHLTVNGYLDLSCVPLETPSGALSMIAGWGPDVTVWLKKPPLRWGASFQVARIGQALWERS